MMQLIPQQANHDSYLNLAGYRFIAITEVESLRETLLNKTASLAILGTILLSHEGININLSAREADILEFLIFLQNDERFADIPFHRTYSKDCAFKRLKVKIKKEIITFNDSSVSRAQLEKRAPHLPAQVLKDWLDQNKDFTLLDVRNDFEIQMGTFKQSLNLNINKFTEFAEKSTALSKQKPLVMFCTGGVRCEKAAVYLQQQGHKQVYQLDGGILGYFNQVGDAHYQGQCFVFDERIQIDPTLTKAQ